MVIPAKLTERFDRSWRLFFRQSAVAATINIVGLFFVFLLQVFLARLIGDSAEFGVYAWGRSLLFLAGMLAAVGVPVVAGRFVASLIATGNERQAREVMRHARRLLAVSGIFLVFVAVLLHGLSGEREGISLALVAPALLLAPAVTFAMLYKDLARARRWLGLALIPLQVLRPVVTGLLCVLAWYLADGELSGYLALWLTGSSVLAVLVFQVLAYHRRQSRLPVAPHAEGVTAEYRANQIMPTAGPVFLTRIAALIMEYSNILLLGVLTGPALAGIYFAADRLAQLTVIPRRVISSVNQQHLAAAHAKGDRDRLRQVIAQSAHGQLWPSVIVVLGLIVLAEPLLALFGDGFQAAAPVLIILALAHAACAFAGPSNDLLLMTGNQRVVPGVMMSCAVVHVVCLVIFAYFLGALGAAIAVAISSVLSHYWLRQIAKKVVGLDTSVLAGRHNT